MPVMVPTPRLDRDLHRAWRGMHASPSCRSSVIHELGHAIGFEREDCVMSLMMTSDGEGIYYGPNAVAPHPTDTQGARANYPGPMVGWPDLAASEFG